MSRPRRRRLGAAALLCERTAELESGSDAHYDDARYYSFTYADRQADIAYYVELATEHGGPVLEYGCGNGRIALPLARAGLEVTGVDRSPPMLADLRSKLRNDADLRARVTVRRGDMRRLKIKRRFPLVLCTFNTFLHLYTRRDVERYCARVREHLTRGGRFVVDVSVPEPEELARDPNRCYRVPRFRHPTTGEVVRYGERFDYDSLSQVLVAAMEFEPRGRPSAGWMTPLAHRQFYPQELEALLHYNGLPVVDIHADYRRIAPTRHAETLVYHCRLGRSF